MGRKWLRAALTGLGICLTVMILSGGFHAADGETFLRILCDALFVPGVLLVCFALLPVVSGEGGFNAVSYGVRKAFDQLRREENRNKTAKTYYDYVTEQQGRKKPIPKPALITGLVFLAASAVVLAIYLKQVS